MKRNGLLVTLAGFAALIMLSVAAIGGVGSRSRASETELVTAAVRSAALTCYAVEGAYPEDLAYLKQHYGLYYDERVYHVTYEAFASNIFPDIYVTEGGGAR